MNKYYEKDIDEILKPIQEKGLGENYDYLLDVLINKCKETEYPGYLYILGMLYERNILKSENPKTVIYYYEEAALLNYLPALIRLNQICLEDIELKYDMNRLICFDSKNYKLLKEDKEGKYLLAKLNMIHQILNDELDEYFLGALSIMKESANEGYEDAIYFMNHCKL